MPAPNSIDDIRSEAECTIAHMYHRTTLHIGTPERRGAADTFEGMLGLAHDFWGSTVGRRHEVRSVAARVREAHGCGPYGFADTYRNANPNADEAVVVEHVRGCWIEISLLLGLDVSESAIR